MEIRHRRACLQDVIVSVDDSGVAGTDNDHHRKVRKEQDGSLGRVGEYNHS